MIILCETCSNNYNQKDTDMCPHCYFPALPKIDASQKLIVKKGKNGKKIYEVQKKFKKII